MLGGREVIGCANIIKNRRSEPSFFFTCLHFLGINYLPKGPGKFAFELVDKILSCYLSTKTFSGLPIH